MKRRSQKVKVYRVKHKDYDEVSIVAEISAGKARYDIKVALESISNKKYFFSDITVTRATEYDHLLEGYRPKRCHSFSQYLLSIGYKKTIDGDLYKD